MSARISEIGTSLLYATTICTEPGRRRNENVRQNSAAYCIKALVDAKPDEIRSQTSRRETRRNPVGALFTFRARVCARRDEHRDRSAPKCSGRNWYAGDACTFMGGYGEGRMPPVQRAGNTKLRGNDHRVLSPDARR